MNEDISNAVKKINDNLTGWRDAYDGALDSVKSGQSKLLERVEHLEERGSRLGKGSTDSPKQDEHARVFCEWIRKPDDIRRKTLLSEAQHEMLSTKQANIGSGSAGGFALPEQISSQVEMRLRQLNPLLDIVNVQQTSTNDFKQLVSMGDGTSGWVGETGTRSETATPTLRERAPTMGEIYAYPEATNWSLDDVFFDVQTWLVNDISDSFSQKISNAIISGTGSDQPTGILNTTPTTAADNASPMRAADVIQYIGLTDVASPAAINIQSLIDLTAEVKDVYLDNTPSTAFVMHRQTAAAIRKLADTQGQFLWEPSNQAGVPASLLGYPVVTCDSMPLIAADAFPVLFGNFRRGYLFADRSDLQITVDQVTKPGHTRFYVRSRKGGTVLNNDSIKALRIAD